MIKKVNTNDFKSSIHTGFIDKSIESEILYRPQLLVNKKIPKEKVLTTIINELENCNEFFISVAFVTASGVATLLNSLIYLEKTGVKGKILVSQYLNFTEPEALKKLKSFKNIELKISVKDNTHSKGYIFKTNDYHNLIIGSSNLTSNALTTNKEWNLKVSGLHSSEIVDKVLNEFQSDFDKAENVTELYISNYENEYNKQRLLNKNQNTNKVENIQPNSMQDEALKNLAKSRKNNNNKALIISATGTGKTYLSAFDVKASGSKKMLFIVHRLNIAKKALETFRKIFNSDKTYGLYSGNKKDLEADFIFSTVQTISKDNHLLNFKKDAFDYIIIDESHRSGAQSYLKLINYFTPNFLLGMTATPERTDGGDIFSLFNHNVAYEIRLNKAMEEDMLSEFHYYGITDLKVNNEEIENTKDFSLLTADERVKQIINKANLYGSDNGITRGLVFCSRKDEAENLSLKFNKNNFKTTFLTGDSSEEERSNAIAKLESDDLNDKLDYIFTVDIFNEGIDIPKINQILMIRPTESAIIFVQQLGRGLRKADGKDYLTVIDFIGNHKNNYLIPIALYGDTTYNKDTLRKLISEGSKMLPGSSTINFDKITKEKIFKSIDSANMKVLNDLKKDYFLLKHRLGRIPMMSDFLNNESRDPFLFIEYSKSYFNFVKKADKDFEAELGKQHMLFLELFSKEINNSKRIEESLILLKLINKNELKVDEFKNIIFEKYGYNVNQDTINSCINNINFSFLRKTENIINIKNNVIQFDYNFIVTLKNKTFKNFLVDSINYSIQTFNQSFELANYNKGLILYKKYSRKDVCRLLNWENDISSTIYGYRTKNKITPCFVTYNKADDIDDTINYNDHFISPSIFAWESRSNRKLDSNEIKNVIESERILLFIKKEDAEGTDFYYMGDTNILEGSIKQSLMAKSKKPVVHFKFKLDRPVVDDLYQYLTTSRSKELQKTLPKAKSISIEERRKRHVIPHFDFYAAAGSFSELQTEKNFTEIEVEEKYASTNDYFACVIIGESMNKRIPNGSICLFKKYTGGSRSGKILLIENRDIQDPDFNSAFTIKTYASQKAATEEGWEHTQILLKPNSFDKSYKDIVINEDNGAEMKVVGEFIKVLN